MARFEALWGPDGVAKVQQRAAALGVEGCLELKFLPAQGTAKRSLARKARPTTEASTGSLLVRLPLASTEQPEPLLRLSASEDDWRALATGELQPSDALVHGRVRLDGSLALARRAMELLLG